MPCYQVNTVSLDFQAGDRALLHKAAAALGLEVRFYGQVTAILQSGSTIATIEGGKATCRATEAALVNKLRVQYSQEIVAHAALKLGWQKVVKAENKLLLRKGV